MSGTHAFGRILVPIDFRELVSGEQGVEVLSVDERKIALSHASRAALQAATRCMATGAELRLLHATPAFDTSRVYRGKASSGLLGGAVEQIHKEAAQTSNAVLQAAAEAYCAEISHSVASRPGLALHVILAEAASFKADLIVIPTSSRGAVARFFLGSTADRVIREAPCPVLVIPAQSSDG